MYGAVRNLKYMYLILSEFEIHIYRKLRTEFFPIDLCPNSKGCGALMTINQRKKSRIHNLQSLPVRENRKQRQELRDLTVIWQALQKESISWLTKRQDITTENEIKM